MPRYNKQEDFEFGLAQVAPFFKSLGFSLSRGEPDTDKAGTSYSARFLCPPRSVELNHLYSLGPVIYSIRNFSVEHTFYVQALGLTAGARFPCFTDDSISGYSALLYDLENLLSPFFTGAEDDFISIATQYMQAQQQQQKTGSHDLTYHATGEDRLKARARELFREGRYKEVIQIESEIKFPKFLTSSEQRMFSIARKKSGT
jgi:hypothetical protein